MSYYWYWPCCSLAVVSLIAGGLSAAEPDAPPLDTRRLPRDQLLLYRDANGQDQPITSPAAWPHRQREIMQGVAAVMGTLPGPERRCPLEPRVEEEIDCGTYVRRSLTYQSEPGSRVPAFLLVPKTALAAGAKPHPAVLCLHPTDNQIGNRVVVGLGGRANRQYASELAELGFVTIAPPYPLLADYQPDLAALGWASGTLKAVWDNSRALDLLETLPFVDQRRFGAIGHSLGGHNAVFTAVHDERIAVVVSSCGLDSFLDYYGGDERVWQPEKGWTQTRYMPRLREYRGRLAAIPFDFHELIAVLAPRRVFIAAPLHDSNFRADSVDRVVAAARAVFQLQGCPEHLVVAHPDCDHDFPQAMREQAYQLIRATLR